MWSPVCDVFKEQTNEEYIRSCSTEELAEWIVKIAFGKEFKTHISKIGYANMHSYKTEVLEWLKKKHEPLKNDKK